MKGITPIIAIIILLLITISLAGAAWSYMSMIFGGVTQKTIVVSGFYCTEGDTANVLVRNMGTMVVSVDQITITDSTGAAVTDGTWTDIEGAAITTISPGYTVRFSHDCDAYCTYRFIYGGAIGLSQQTVSIPCG